MRRPLPCESPITIAVMRSRKPLPEGSLFPTTQIFRPSPDRMGAVRAGQGVCAGGRWPGPGHAGARLPDRPDVTVFGGGKRAPHRRAGKPTPRSDGRNGKVIAPGRGCTPSSFVARAPAHARRRRAGRRGGLTTEVGVPGRFATVAPTSAGPMGRTSIVIVSYNHATFSGRAWRPWIRPGWIPRPGAPVPGRQRLGRRHRGPDRAGPAARRCRARRGACRPSSSSATRTWASPAATTWRSAGPWPTGTTFAYLLNPDTEVGAGLPAGRHRRRPAGRSGRSPGAEPAPAPARSDGRQQLRQRPALPRLRLRRGRRPAASRIRRCAAPDRGRRRDRLPQRGRRPWPGLSALRGDWPVPGRAVPLPGGRRAAAGGRGWPGTGCSWRRVARSAQVRIFDRAAQKFHWLERNRWLVLLWCYRGPTLLLLRPRCWPRRWACGPLALHGGWWREKAARLPLPAPPRAGPQLLATRRQVQALRTRTDRQVSAQFTGRIVFEAMNPWLLTRVANPVFAAYWGLARRLMRW